MPKTTETKNTSQVALRVPRALLAKIDAQCTKKGKTRTDFIIEILAATLERGATADVGVPGAGLEHQVQDLAHKLEALTQRLEKMEGGAAQRKIPAATPKPQRDAVASQSTTKDALTGLSRSAKRIPREIDQDGWMFPMAAWEMCGGEPREDATLPNRNTNPRAKKGPVIYTNWRKSKAPAFREWGFEMDEERKKAGHPWLRLLPDGESRPPHNDREPASQT